MAELSSSLYQRCQAVLLKCEEFDDLPSLRAIFVSSELAEYQARLPRSRGRAGRVSQTVQFLLGSYLSDGRPVFPIFLETLRDRYDPRDAQYYELEQLRAEVEHELGFGYIDIPFVILAMTHNEATDLITETVFNNPAVAPAERIRFETFGKALREYGIEDLLSHYGEHREDWRPHTHSQSTIQEIILDMVDRINQQRPRLPARSMIRPQFISSSFFSDDENIRLEMWIKLGQLGGMIIVDAVSMFHPMLSQLLLHSRLGADKRVAMLMLSPVDPNAIPVNQLIEYETRSHMEQAFARFDRNLDRLCEFGVGDLRGLKRRLLTILPEVAELIVHQRPNPSTLRIFREKVGEPSGVEQLIFGRRGER
jgi:hypothetical protein